MKEYKNLVLDEERALYGIMRAQILNCEFDGPKDGESALKGASLLEIKNSNFNLRYPLWHVTKASIIKCSMSEKCRAALWYDKNIIMKESNLNGIKAFRECNNVIIEDSKINSSEFAWFCSEMKIKNTELISEYPFMQSRNIELDNFTLQGKYSFQYVQNSIIKNSNLDTKDAFWHSNNLTITDSIIKGEYLGWYSQNLKLIRCKIIGTQPLCYAKGLVLEDCEMIDCDLAFENSDVTATIKGEIVSIKNPQKGIIKADKIGQIILEKETECKIVTTI
ncbi:hypothetical protein FV113G1_14750 [Fusobacterium varium]|nr:hypothetical protein FV113G1_14750 [Fusobacterium varium]